MARYSTDPVTTKWLASMGRLDRLLAHLKEPIEGMLRLAVRVLPRAFDSGMFHDRSQWHKYPAFPFDMWVQPYTDSIALTVKAGQWYALLEFHTISKAKVEAKRQARMAPALG